MKIQKHVKIQNHRVRLRNQMLKTKQIDAIAKPTDIDANPTCCQ